MDPFKTWKPRGAPGAETVGDFLAGPRRNKPTPVGGVTPQETLQLADYLRQQIAGAGQAVEGELIKYTLPNPKNTSPPAQSAPVKKVFEEIGGLAIPSYFVKALTELGEGEVPFTQRRDISAPGLGVFERPAIDRQIDAERAARELFYAQLSAELVRSRAINSAAALLSQTVLSASIQPEHITPTNGAALANMEAAEGIRRALVHERADP